jgi:transposase
MPQKHVVQLGDGDRRQLQSLLRAGRCSARALTRARVLLKADDGLSDEQIAEELDVGLSLIYEVRHRFARQGLDATLHRRPSPPRPDQRKLDGDGEAHLIALACSTPPAGHGRWTLRLLADRLVELAITDHVSHETVRTVLKKTS